MNKDKCNLQDREKFNKEVEESKIRAKNLSEKVEEAAKYFNEFFKDIKPYNENDKNNK